MSEGPIKLKKVDVLNDYLAILLGTPNTDLQLPEGAEAKFNNEGLVVGVGPDVNKGLAHNYTGDDVIKIGDHVAIRSNKYTLIETKSGCYEGRRIAMVHKPDLIYRHTRADPQKHQFVDVWDATDHEDAIKANL
jgi:hypothetical protein